MRRIRAGVGLVVGIMLVTAFASGQEPKTEARAKGQLPPNWGKLGLSDDQKQQVYKIQTKYRGEIDALDAKIKDLRKQQTAALDKVLTEPQKTRLREIVTSKVPGAEDKKTEKKSKQP
jgi:hypothetical protein